MGKEIFGKSTDGEKVSAAPEIWEELFTRLTGTAHRYALVVETG